MTYRINQPEYCTPDFSFVRLNGSDFGRLLADNGADVTSLESSIQVMTENSANVVWELTFGTARNKSHIAEDNWTSLLSWNSVGKWISDFNESKSQGFEQQLQEIVKWPNIQQVLFIKGPCECIVTQWIDFIRNWMSFIEYDDDGAFIVPIGNDNILRISPVGTILIGTLQQDE